VDERSTLDGVEALVEAWCDRRCLDALRELLRAYPPALHDPDAWAALAEALEAVRDRAGHELAPGEAKRIEALAAAAWDAVRRVRPGWPADAPAGGSRRR
jgi:hypothetical protein